ncbi:MAG: trypsin-like peptidase domain-containing protein [Phycisphaerae bacterium]|nr:trypsin-like peptidase domain-containing protein [Phycisphaerae bacterium]
MKRRRLAMLSIAAVLVSRPVRGDDTAAPPETPEVVRLQASFQSVADRVSPSVVAISVSLAPAEDDAVLRRDEMNPEKLEDQLDRATRTVGTGMILSADGYILTNEHVISQGQQLWITTDDRQVYPALVVGSDPRADLAVLKIPANGLHPITFGAEAVRRGQWTIAIGNPFGLAEAGEMAMSVGVVSATERSLPRLTSHENRLYNNLIQTTAQINPGSSGGPLFDLNGRVIGVNTAVIMPQKQSNGIGFALPITASLRREVDKLRRGEEIVYGYLGVMVSTPSVREREIAGVPADRGVCINAVDPDDRGAVTLRPGDIVYAMNDVPVIDADQFICKVGESQVEKPLTLSVSREGSLGHVVVVPRKRNVPSVAVSRDVQRLRWHGMLLGPVPMATEAPQLSGVMVFDIDPSSSARKLGIVPGSVITAIGGRAIADVLELQKLINDSAGGDSSLTAHVERGDVAMIER